MHMTLNEQLRMQTRIYQTNKQKGKVKLYPSNVSKYKEQTNYYPCKNRTASYRTYDRFHNISK